MKDNSGGRNTYASVTTKGSDADDGTTKCSSMFQERGSKMFIHC